MKNLFLSLWDVRNIHAQEYMKKLGITYKKAVPQSLLDGWCFFACENVPEPLPKGLSTLKQSPNAYVGHGLSEQDAKELKRYMKKHEGQT